MDICRAIDISAALLSSSGDFIPDGKGGSFDGGEPIVEFDGGGGLKTVGVGPACCRLLMLAFLSSEDTGGLERGVSGLEATGKSALPTLGLVSSLLANLLSGARERG